MSNYLQFSKKKIEDLTKEDIENILFYPMKIGTYKKKDLMIHIGPYGKYLKYDSKNIKIEQKDKYTKDYLIEIIKR